MDLSKYKKIKEDKRSTTMEAPGGHTITLMHAKMPRIQVEQLKRLKLAKGGAVKMADGGEPDAEAAPAPEAAAPPATNITINAAPAQGAAPAPASNVPPQAPPSGVAPTVAQPVPYQASREMPNSAGMHADQTPQFEPMRPPESAPPILSKSGTMDPGAVANDTQRQAELQRDIDVQRGNVEAGLQGAKVNDLAQNAAQISNNYNEVKKHYDDYADYIRNHPVDAQNYIKNMGGGQKIATSLGLLLGGFGQGYRGGSNAAEDWLNKQVDRDIDAQRANQAGQKNILDAYESLYGKGAAATAAAKASIIDLYGEKAKQVALQFNTPQAWSNYLKFRDAAAIAASKQLQESAVGLSSLPGTGGAGRGGGHGGGQGGAPAQAPSHDSILTPHAEQHFKNLQYTPKAKDNYAAIQQQYNGAVQADKALAQIHDTFKGLGKAAEEGSIGGNLRRQGGHALGGVPLVGGALQGALNYVTDTPANRSYDSDQSALLGYISSALKGTNIGSGQIQEIVNANSPEQGDPPELAAKKEQAIREFIKNHTDTSLLKAWGLSY